MTGLDGNESYDTQSLFPTQVAMNSHWKLQGGKDDRNLIYTIDFRLVFNFFSKQTNHTFCVYNTFIFN